MSGFWLGFYLCPVAWFAARIYTENRLDPDCHPVWDLLVGLIVGACWPLGVVAVIIDYLSGD